MVNDKLRTSLRGADHPNWKGGTQPQDYKERVRFRKTYQKKVLARDNYTCQVCGIKNHKGLGRSVKIHVDHIKPIRKHWELRLDPENTQVLCEACNHGKGSWDETDFRPDETKLDLETLAEEYAQLVETKNYH